MTETVMDKKSDSAEIAGSFQRSAEASADRIAAAMRAAALSSPAVFVLGRLDDGELRQVCRMLLRRAPEAVREYRLRQR